MTFGIGRNSIVGVFLGPFVLGEITPFFDKPIVQLDMLTLGLW